MQTCLPKELEGGIILACSEDFFTMSQVMILQHSITVTVTSKKSNEAWTITSVYDPQDDSSKMLFLQELLQIKQSVSSRWVLLRDFKFIYMASDKSNSRVNWRMMNQFRTIFEDLEVKELRLHSRRFTWSSGTANPT
jgi:hypothetical protein